MERKEVIKGSGTAINKGSSTTIANNNSFLVAVTGGVESAEIFGVEEIYCKYNMVYGGDWRLSGGIEDGISQITGKSNDGRFVWNFPIEATFKSMNPHGWPQIVFSVYGSDYFGNHIVRGYGSTHLPICHGSYVKKVPLFVPESSTFLQKLSSWLVGRKPEFVDPKILAHSEGRQVIRVNSNGSITLKLEVIMKDFQKHGYCSESTPQMSSII